MAYKGKYKGSEIDNYLTKAKEMSETYPDMIGKTENNLRYFESGIANIVCRFDKTQTISAIETRTSAKIELNGTLGTGGNAAWIVGIFDISEFRGKYIMYSNSAVYNNYLSYSISSDMSFSKDSIIETGGNVKVVDKVLFIPNNSSYIAICCPSPSKTIYSGIDVVEKTEEISHENQTTLSMLNHQIDSKKPNITWEQGGFVTNGNLYDRTYGVRTNVIPLNSISFPFSIFIKKLNENCKFQIRGGTEYQNSKEIIKGYNGDKLSIETEYPYYYFYIETNDQSDITPDLIDLEYEFVGFEKIASKEYVDKTNTVVDVIQSSLINKKPTITWVQGGFAYNGGLIDVTYGLRTNAIPLNNISVPFSISINKLNENCVFKVRSGNTHHNSVLIASGKSGDVLYISESNSFFYFYVETNDQSDITVDSLILDYELASFDKCVSRDDLVTLENQLGLDKYVALFGDSLSQGPNKFIRNYFDQIGYKWSNNAIGGETSTIMASRIGAGTAIVDEEVVIPESGSVNVKLVSSLVDSEFNNLSWSMRSNKGLTGSVGYSPVTINGILGDLETSSVGIVMFDSSGKVVHKGSSNSGSTLTSSNMSGTPTSYIICCNKGKEGEAHINLNNSEVDVAAICTIQNARLKADGTTEYNENYTCSEVIPISSFQNIYYDALASQDKPTFSRREAGQVEYVAKGSPVISNQCHIFDKTINIMFINNFATRSGIPIEEDYVFQFKQMAERNLNKKYIVATTYWFARDGVEDTANKIIKSMRQAFGMHYIDFYGYFKNSSINDAIAMGLITESEASGKTWEQLFMGGDIHQNDKGSYLCARQIIKKGIELGYWDEGDYSWDAIYSAT